jgi:hypothetical protein
MAVPERQLRGLGWALYCTALLFVASPALEVLATSYPFHPGAPAWRLAALGLLAQSLPVPVFGVLLALVAAVLLKQRAAQTAVSLLCGLGAASLLAAFATFALDVLQLRRSVRPSALTGFDMTVSRSAFIMLYCAAVLVILAVLGMRRRGVSSQEGEAASLVGMGRRSKGTR